MNRNYVFIACAVALYFGLKRVYGKWDGTVDDLPNKIFGWVALALAVGFIFGTPRWGSKIPGSFFERAEYKRMFYVNLFPDGQKVKSYRVPALIRASIESDSYYVDDAIFDGERTSSWREYRIEFAIMPNGEKVVFYDAFDLDYLELGKAVTIFDDYGKCWRVELTEQAPK